MKMITAALLVALSLIDAANAIASNQIATDDETLCRHISALARSIATEKLKGATYEMLLIRSKSVLGTKPESSPKMFTSSVVEAILKGVWGLDSVFTPDRVGKLYYLNCVSDLPSPS